MVKTTTHLVLDGETLQSIAQKVLKDPTRWTEIAILNSLKYPFISSLYDTRQDNVAMPGDVILIPSDISDTQTVTELQDDTIYGSDLLLTGDTSNLSFDSGGELSVDTYGDLQIASGTQCLLQDLTHRMLTEIGTMPYHPEYGSKILTIIGSRSTDNWRDKTAIELIRTFKCDPRVFDVTNVSVESVPNGGVGVTCNIVTFTNTVSFRHNF